MDDQSQYNARRAALDKIVSIYVELDGLTKEPAEKLVRVREILGPDPDTKALVEKAKECVVAWNEWANDETQHFPSGEWLNSMEELEDALSRLQGGKNGE